MKLPSLRIRLLQARLAVARLGWSAPLAGLACLAGAACWLWWLPAQQARATEQSATIARLERALKTPAKPAPAPEPSPAQARLAAFHATLGEHGQNGASLRTMFELARESGLTLSQGDYNSQSNRNSRTDAYRVVLPVVGSYAAIRRFCETTLLAIPFASLDEISFKRSTVGSPVLEARLRFTLHLKQASANVGGPAPHRDSTS
ncbi:hypothetical protein EV683_12112 [Crenobacter luteus]|uniref:hypothetical protein n=1 Tax=Crenobacter luteus TaxID=1452487 RepID=UPI001047B2CB|nr:hypothetical protein [Crenobacter luteus]TCP10612.1 hypothetical protein EV683_12112 [Crenobacter luteus]